MTFKGGIFTRNVYLEQTGTVYPKLLGDHCVSKGLLRISMLYMPRFSLILVMLDDARRVMMVMVCQ